MISISSTGTLNDTKGGKVCICLTVTGEVKELGHFTRGAVWVARVWKTSVWITKLIEEWMAQSLDGR